MIPDTASILEAQLRTNPGARSLLERSLRWMKGFYDPDAQLLNSPNQRIDGHQIRESIWYALGLVVAKHCLSSSTDAELARLPLLVHRVLQAQWDTPGSAWHGTFRRTPSEPDPPADAKMWRDYDPNWRQFIGTVLVLLLRLEGDGALADQADDIAAALKLCVQGEPVDRVPASYTNIALMRAWLEAETADITGGQYRERALCYASKIAAGFDLHDTFAEYNSPTYYGINLYALGLWHHYSREPALNELGKRISNALWRDMARFYHRGMKNFCGPWSRAYGMDMQRYVAAVGLWIWSAYGEPHAPFPFAGLASGAIDHAHDFALGPLAAITTIPPPDDVAGSFMEAAADAGFHSRAFSQVITDSPLRVAHAWLTPTLMAGAEASAVSYRGTDQYHPFTLHWRQNGIVHWLRLRFAGRLQGLIRDGSIALTLIPDDGETRCHWQSSDPLAVSGNRWYGSGLSLSVKTTLSATETPGGILLTGIIESSAITITPEDNRDLS